MSSDLPTRLHKWLQEEVQFRPSGKHAGKKLPTPEVLQKLCIGELKPFWEYTISHIRSPAIVRQVRGNLQLHKVKQCSERSTEQNQLEKQYEMKLKELNGLDSSLEYEANHIKQLQADLTNREMTCKLTDFHIEDERHRQMHHRLVRQKIKKEIEEIKEKSSYLKSSYQRIFGAASLPGSKTYSTTSGSRTPRIETHCGKSVRENCEAISSILSSVIKEKKYEETMDQHTIKNSVWKEFERILLEHSNETILSCLVSETGTSELQFQKKSLQMESYTPDVLFEDGQPTPSKEDLVRESSAAIIAASLETLQSRVKHMENIKRLEKNKEDILQKLTDVGADDVCRNVANKQLQVAKLEGEAASCRAFLEDFQRKHEDSTKIDEFVKNLEEQLKNSEHQIELNKCLIEGLMDRNIHSVASLRDVQVQNMVDKENSFFTDNKSVMMLRQQLRDTVLNEMNLYEKLNLTMVPHGRTCIVPRGCFSIHRLTVMEMHPGQDLIKVLHNSLGLPAGVSIERILVEVMALVQQHREAMLRKNTSGTLRRLMSLTTADSCEFTEQKIYDLVNQMKMCEREQQMVHLPLLQKANVAAAQGMELVQKIRQLLAEWWEQPIKEACLSYESGGRTLKQWQTIFSIATKKLEQLKTDVK